MAVTALSAILSIIGYAKSEWDKLPPEEKRRIRAEFRKGNVAMAKRIAKAQKKQLKAMKKVQRKQKKAAKGIMAKLGLNPCTWLWAGKKKKKKSGGAWYG